MIGQYQSRGTVNVGIQGLGLFPGQKLTRGPLQSGIMTKRKSSRHAGGRVIVVIVQFGFSVGSVVGGLFGLVAVCLGVEWDEDRATQNKFSRSRCTQPLIAGKGFRRLTSLSDGSFQGWIDAGRSRTIIRRGMCIARSFDHLLYYCELPIQRAVPLALATLYISNPEFSVIDLLSRLSHDPDAQLAQNAILGLGIANAGTNNSRVAGLFRQLSEFDAKDTGHIFCVRLAQGFLHMGKGLMTLSPFHSDRMLLNGSALGGMLVLLHSCLDLKKTVLDKSHCLLYYLTFAMHPRMLITVSYNDAPVPGADGENPVEPEVDDVVMEWRPGTVRVGQHWRQLGRQESLDASLASKRILRRFSWLPQIVRNWVPRKWWRRVVVPVLCWRVS